MILVKGLYIGISINTVPGFIAEKTMDSRAKTLLELIAPRTNSSDVYSCYNLFDHVPTEDDKSKFAEVYRGLQKLVEKGELEGPYAEDHPAVFNRFEYVDRKRYPGDLLVALQSSGFAIKITRICRHKNLTEDGKDKEDLLVEEAKNQLAEWIGDDIIIDQREPDPIKQIMLQKENYFINRKKVFGVSLGDLLDRIFQLSIVFIVAGICIYTFSFHWIAGIFVSLFIIGFVWWTRH